MAAIPDKYLDLLQQKKAFANLATLMPDGSPQVTPVWFDYTDGVIRVNTAKGRVKARNLKVGSPVALAIMDPDEPYRYLQIRGRGPPCHGGGCRRAYRLIGQEVPRKGQVPVPPTRRSPRHVRNRAEIGLRNGLRLLGQPCISSRASASGSDSIG